MICCLNSIFNSRTLISRSFTHHCYATLPLAVTLGQLPERLFQLLGTPTAKASGFTPFSQSDTQSESVCLSRPVFKMDEISCRTKSATTSVNSKGEADRSRTVYSLPGCGMF